MSRSSSSDSAHRVCSGGGGGAPDTSAHALLSLSTAHVTADGGQRSHLRRGGSVVTSDENNCSVELLMTSEPLAPAPETPLPVDTAANASGPKRVRKRTYYMRKEETEALQDELQELEARMAFYHAREGLADQWRHIRQQQLDNRVLRGAIRSQWLHLASAHGLTGHFLQEHSSASSFEAGIRLGLDPAQRHATLLALKAEKLADAVRFLRQRGRGLSRTRASVDTQRFETELGDYCSMRFDVTPFEGLRSARQVFDAYLDFAFNMEINVSETLGDITIREDDEIIGSPSDGVSHHRMVSTISHSVQLDLNSVVFSEFVSSGDTLPSAREDNSETDELGVVVFDVVDDDALYPYRPSERVRQDITCLALVTSFRRRRESPDGVHSLRRSHSVAQVADDELVVVLHRWSLLKVHRPEFSIQEEIQARMRSGIEHVGDAILATVRQAVYASSSAAPTLQQPPPVR